MARYDVHVAPKGRGYLLDVQADLLSHLETSVVVPLVPLEGRLAAVPDLNPEFLIADERHILMPTIIAAVPRRALGRPVANLRDESWVIARALDTLLTGF
jgi:toxin CcdB